MKSEQPPEPISVAVTGAGGFIGRNLLVRLRELGFTVHGITRDTPPDEARRVLGESAVVVHLAAANRPDDPAEFDATNRGYTSSVAEAIEAGGKRPLVIHCSSRKAGEQSDYGRSKQAGEAVMISLGARGAATVAAYRLPNVFGKWARPNYNSAIATFCHNLARGLPITIDDPEAPLSLVYVDDLIDQWIDLMRSPPSSSGVVDTRSVYPTTVGAVADQLRRFADWRKSGRVDDVGSGLPRALYATFIAALPEEAFSFPLERHVDGRGAFTEVLKTGASGQMSVLTAHPGVTRGGHYHHSKVERFLVVCGTARFRFRHILTGETKQLETSGDVPRVVETVPGWAHDITNVGDELMVSLLWANELFDPERPDTVAMPL